MWLSRATNLDIATPDFPEAQEDFGVVAVPSRRGELSMRSVSKSVCAAYSGWQTSCAPPLSDDAMFRQYKQGAQSWSEAQLEPCMPVPLPATAHSHTLLTHFMPAPHVTPAFPHAAPKPDTIGASASHTP
jgi:hypothetical protein